MFKGKINKKVTLIAAVSVLGMGGLLGGLLLPQNQYEFDGGKKASEALYGTGYEIDNSVAKLYGNKTGKMKVGILEETGVDSEVVENAEGLDLEKMRDEQLEAILAENGLTMYDYVNQKNQIEDAVLAKIQNVLDEYEEKLAKVEANQGKTGAAGKDGKDGIDGRDGRDGTAGKTGKTGATGATGKTGPAGPAGPAGKTGAAGKDGKDGIDGRDGLDGKNSYIRYSSNKQELLETPNGNTKYIGTYLGTKASTNPADYTWTQYKDMVMFYDENSQTLQIRG